MLPPERIDRHGPLPAPDLAGEERRCARRARALDQQLRPLDEQHDRGRDLLVGDRDDVVEPRAEDRRGQLARALDRDPLRDRVTVLRPACQRRTCRCLDADEPELRPQRAERYRDPRREPAASDGDHDGAGLRHLLRELEPDRPLAGDHLLVFEAVQESRARRACELQRRLERAVEGLGPGLDPGAVGARRLDLGHRRVPRHEDRRRDPSLAGRPGDGLAVVPGGRGDDAGGPLGLGERMDLVDGAAHLEGARALEVLGLEQHRASRHAREGLRAEDGCDPRDPVDPGARRLDVSECGRGSRRQP